MHSLHINSDTNCLPDTENIGNSLGDDIIWVVMLLSLMTSWTCVSCMNVAIMLYYMHACHILYKLYHNLFMVEYSSTQISTNEREGGTNYQLNYISRITRINNKYIVT